jgi:N-acetyl-beta-hexosaminidase
MRGLRRGIGVWEEAAKDGGLDEQDAYVCALLSDGEELARDGYNVVSTPSSRYYLDMKLYEGMPFGMDQVVTPEMAYAFDPNGDWPATYDTG